MISRKLGKIISFSSKRYIQNCPNTLKSPSSIDSVTPNTQNFHELGKDGNETKTAPLVLMGPSEKYLYDRRPHDERKFDRYRRKDLRVEQGKVLEIRQWLKEIKMRAISAQEDESLPLSRPFLLKRESKSKFMYRTSQEDIVKVPARVVSMIGKELENSWLNTVKVNFQTLDEKEELKSVKKYKEDMYFYRRLLVVTKEKEKAQEYEKFKEAKEAVMKKESEKKSRIFRKKTNLFTGKSKIKHLDCERGR